MPKIRTVLSVVSASFGQYWAGWLRGELIPLIHRTERRQTEMSKDEYLEFITHQPYDAMGDFSFLLDEKSDKAENTMVENENMNAD